MAKSRAKPRGANKYTPPAKSSAPGWIWLVAGIVIGGFIMFLMKLEPKQDIRKEQKPTASVRPKENTSDKPKFEFPQLLSGNENAGTGTATPNLTEEQRNKLDGARAAALLDGKTPPVVPPPAPQVQPAPVPTPTPTPTPTQVTTQKPAVQTPTTQAAKTEQVAVATPPTSNMKFFLQVGSYPTKGSAESIRAQLLMLGQNAKLETASSNNKTWYRILVGPFNTKETASTAQNQLTSQGFKQTLIIPRKTQ